MKKILPALLVAASAALWLRLPRPSCQKRRRHQIPPERFVRDGQHFGRLGAMANGKAL
jgi:hypothetical protein